MLHLDIIHAQSQKATNEITTIKAFILSDAIYLHTVSVNNSALDFCTVNRRKQKSSLSSIMATTLRITNKVIMFAEDQDDSCVRSFIEKIYDDFGEIVKNSQLEGLNHVINRKLHILERFVFGSIGKAHTSIEIQLQQTLHNSYKCISLVNHGNLVRARSQDKLLVIYSVIKFICSQSVLVNCMAIMLCRSILYLYVSMESICGPSNSYIT